MLQYKVQYCCNLPNGQVEGEEVAPGEEVREHVQPTNGYHGQVVGEEVATGEEVREHVQPTNVYHGQVEGEEVAPGEEGENTCNLPMVIMARLRERK